MHLNNKIALVTGGASGIGAAIGTHFASLGVKVALADRDENLVQEKARAIGALGLACNVAQAQAAEGAFALLREKWGAPDILVNAAGTLGAGKILGKEKPMDLDFFAQVLSVNLVGSFNMLRLAAQGMREKGAGTDGERGVIINIGSIAGQEGQIGQAAYSASKAGLEGLTLPAARELARYGIRVVTLAPGLVKTQMLAGLSEAAFEELAQSIPFPKRLADPSEIAFLAQHVVENRFINGSILRIDGALRMG